MQLKKNKINPHIVRNLLTVLKSSIPVTPIHLFPVELHKYPITQLSGMNKDLFFNKKSTLFWKSVCISWKCSSLNSSHHLNQAVLVSKALSHCTCPPHRTTFSEKYEADLGAFSTSRLCFTNARHYFTNARFYFTNVRFYFTNARLYLLYKHVDLASNQEHRDNVEVEVEPHVCKVEPCVCKVEPHNCEVEPRVCKVEPCRALCL